MNAGFILEVCALKHDSLLIQVCFYVPPPPAFMFDHVLSKCYSIQFHCTYKSIDSPGTTCQMLNGVKSIKSVRRRRWFFNLHSLQITAGCMPVGILHRRFWWVSQVWLLWSAKTHRTLKAYSKQGLEMTKYIRLNQALRWKQRTNKTWWNTTKIYIIFKCNWVYDDKPREN